MRTVRPFALLLTLLLTLLLSGCQVKSPTVNVQSASVSRLTPQKLDLNIQFKVKNPNTFDIPLQRAAWTIEVFGQRVGDGVADFSQTIPAQQTAPVTMPLSVSLQAIANQIPALLTRKPIPVRVDIELTFSSPFGPISTSFTHEEEVKNPL